MHTTFPIHFTILDSVTLMIWRSLAPVTRCKQHYLKSSVGTLRLGAGRRQEFRSLQTQYQYTPQSSMRFIHGIGDCATYVYPVRISISVDLPAPEGPMMAVSSPD